MALGEKDKIYGGKIKMVHINQLTKEMEMKIPEIAEFDTEIIKPHNFIVYITDRMYEWVNETTK